MHWHLTLPLTFVVDLLKSTKPAKWMSVEK